MAYDKINAAYGRLIGNVTHRLYISSQLQAARLPQQLVTETVIGRAFVVYNCALLSENLRASTAKTKKLN